jgi:putative protease
VELEPGIPLQPGDGIVFDTGGDTNAEQGGRIFEIRGNRYYFQHGHIQFNRLKAGDRVWKTHDPALEKRLQQSFAGTPPPKKRIPLKMRVQGTAGQALCVEATLADGGTAVRVASSIPLENARTAPLGKERLAEHLGKFGDSPFFLSDLEVALEGALILPIAELNRVRRALVVQLEDSLRPNRIEHPIAWQILLKEESVARKYFAAARRNSRPRSKSASHGCTSISKMSAATAKPFPESATTGGQPKSGLPRRASKKPANRAFSD